VTSLEDRVQLLEAQVRQLAQELKVALEASNLETSLPTNFQDNEDWRPNRTGKGETLRLSEIKDPLRNQFNGPNIRINIGDWHYRSWEGSNGEIMVSRYPRTFT